MYHMSPPPGQPCLFQFSISFLNSVKIYLNLRLHGLLYIIILKRKWVNFSKILKFKIRYVAFKFLTEVFGQNQGKIIIQYSLHCTPVLTLYFMKKIIIFDVNLIF